VTMNFDLAREMSGKSIACAIAGDDAAVRPRSFRRDGAILPARSLQKGARLPGRDATFAQRRRRSRQYATRSIGIASRAAWFRKAGKPAVDIARQFVAGPAFADVLARFVRNPFQSYPFGPRSFNSILSHLTGWLPRWWAYALIGGTETRDAEARPHHF
jgi:hypothetical protein